MHSEVGRMQGRYPAIVKSYDQTTRQCRVSIEGVTNGGDILPLAEIEYPIGDKSLNGGNATEIEILPNDTVWVAFIGGDPRYPIITGYRNPQAGNSADWRTWHHKNIELIAVEVMRLISDETEVNATTLTINANVVINGDIESTGTMTNNGKDVGSSHTHGGVQSGGSNTSTPN